MSLPKRNRRTITVDGTLYHYTVAFGRSERAVVQHSNGRGSCLFLLQQGDISPKLVAQAIQLAVANGWMAGQSGPAIWLDLDLESEQYKLASPENPRIKYYSTCGKPPEEQSLPAGTQDDVTA